MGQFTFIFIYLDSVDLLITLIHNMLQKTFLFTKSIMDILHRIPSVNGPCRKQATRVIDCFEL